MMNDFFLCNKYSPTTLNDIDHNQLKIKYLKNIKSINEINNIIIYGLPNSGKYTIIKCFLNHLNNNEQIIIKKNKITYENRKLEYYYSNLHYEINLLNQVEYRKKEHLQFFLKTIIKTKTIFNNSIKLIIIRYFDKLCKTGQYSLRRTMETYSKTCRFILITSALNNVIPALQSRCLIIRIKLSTKYELLTILQKIVSCEKENINDAILSIIISISQRNILEVINNLQIYLLNPEILFRNHLQIYSEKIFKIINSKLMFYKKIKQIDDVLYELLLDNIDLIDFLKKTISYIIKNQDYSKQQKYKIIQYVSNVSVYMINDNKPMINIKDIFCYIVKILTKKNNIV